LVHRVAVRLPPQYALLVVFGLLLLVLRLVYSQPLHTRPLTVTYALCMMGIFVVASLLSQARHLVGRDRIGRRTGLQHALYMVRDWLPFVVCLWVYENLHDLTRLIRPDSVDDALSRADVWLFGVQPTLWFERWLHPLLTDYMALAYMTYFVFPFLLGGWLYFRGQIDEFEELQLALLITFYVGFLGYILVPAVGPQIILREQYSEPLQGRYVYWHAKQVVLTLQNFPRDCFPSLHTAVSSVTLFFLLRHRRHVPLRPLVLPVWTILTASLWVSTVYLRYHWVVDVFAGWALTALSCAGGIFLQRRWPERGGEPG
jgi:membrane-associated phospholipid phosphatase